MPFGAGGASAREGEMGGRQGGLRLRAAGLPGCRAAALRPDTRTACPERGLGRSAGAEGAGREAPCPLRSGLSLGLLPTWQEPAAGTAERPFGAEPLAIPAFVRWMS